ncbi:hypothetical protein BN871_EL_00110 [Paenibacillus sp. P22]|nr:hypothetical protein BN871_EL_00110 [Paenibacillus sp. P22]
MMRAALAAASIKKTALFLRQEKRGFLGWPMANLDGRKSGFGPVVVD